MQAVRQIALLVIYHACWDEGRGSIPVGLYPLPHPPKKNKNKAKVLLSAPSSRLGERARQRELTKFNQNPRAVGVPNPTSKRDKAEGVYYGGGGSVGTCGNGLSRMRLRGEHMKSSHELSWKVECIASKNENGRKANQPLVFLQAGFLWTKVFGIVLCTIVFAST